MLFAAAVHDAEHTGEPQSHFETRIPLHFKFEVNPSVSDCIICDLCFLLVRVIVISQIIKLQLIIEKRRPEVLTLPLTFYHLTVSRNVFLEAEMRQLGAARTKGLKYYLRHDQ